MKVIVVLRRVILLAAMPLLTVATACDQVPQGSAARAPQPAPTSVTRHASAATLNGEPTVIVDDTLRPPDFVEPGARQIIDQMIGDYENYVTQYRDLARQGQTDDHVFVKADSLLRHAENVYSGLVDAMEINTFTGAQRRRLESAKRRLDRLAKQYHAYQRPQRSNR